jgi:glycerol-3-phosphate dehydrogenase (NAD(P)+)
MTERVAVLGAGSWGTTVAAIVAANVPTTLWARRAELAADIEHTRENASYLPGSRLPDTLRVTASLEEACIGAEVVVIAVPSHGFRAVLDDTRPFVDARVPIISLTKGVEQGTLLRMTEVVLDVLAGHEASRVGVLTGPNLAREVAAGQPTASVVAVADPSVADEMQRLFWAANLRVYTNPDVVGCEVAGVVKNVIAIASGMAEGMGFGDNTRATLITRGLAEMSRLGVSLGGEPLTFAGLAGMGDLIATCSSRQSRNNTVGFELGKGRSIDEIVGEMHMVAEGVKSCASVLALAEAHGIDMPITEQVVEVCHHGRTVGEALTALMQRDAKPELAP